MKKILLIMAIGLIGCSQPNNSPAPALTPNTTPVVNSYSFEGNWDCNHWVVNTATGETHQRRFIISNQVPTSIVMSLNDYNSNGTFNQLITNSNALIDSNYFDDMNNTSQTSFKGVLTTDSTLMVYQYEVNTSGVVDTIQNKEFKKQ
jgi:hypothetical protein